MPTPQSAPFGSWKSPLTSELIVSEAIKLGQLRLDGENVYWVEGRPTEGGRNVIVRQTPDTRKTDLTASPLNVRSRVYEYGGGAYLVIHDSIYFSNFSDQRLYRQDHHDSTATPLTAEGPYRYADFTIDHLHNRLIGIREDHSDSHSEPTNVIVSISLDDNSQRTYGQILVVGHDFYAAPRLSPNDRQLAWLAWNHPNMPWDGTELWVADVQSDGSLQHARCVAGGGSESIFQPEWSPSGTLHFISDRTGWWNLYSFHNDHIAALYRVEAEFGTPQWNLGLSTYAFQDSDHIICAYTKKGRWHLGCLATELHTLNSFDLPYTDIEGIQVKERYVYCLASSPTIPPTIIRIDLITTQPEILHRSFNAPVHEDYFSIPEAIEYPSDDGEHAHAFFYPPQNRDFRPPPDERPPLIVKSHGGPTGSCGQSFNLMIQYWTSRGFAVLDVNYGGSSGYGRSYRERLHGQWGIVDVTDCIHGVQFLIHRGNVDARRVAITGGSAGGYTALCALTFHNIFTGGSSYYGISDLEALVHDTHKFESRYLDRLIGPYPLQQELYRQRSPIHFAHQLSCPIILFQGLEDKVVPPNQAERMVEALKEKGLPVAYVAFEGEQHGFRNAKNIQHVLEAELFFYSIIFTFSPAEPLAPVQIFNEHGTSPSPPAS